MCTRWALHTSGLSFPNVRSGTAAVSYTRLLGQTSRGIFDAGVPIPGVGYSARRSGGTLLRRLAVVVFLLVVGACSSDERAVSDDALQCVIVDGSGSVQQFPFFPGGPLESPVINMEMNDGLRFRIDHSQREVSVRVFDRDSLVTLVAGIEVGPLLASEETLKVTGTASSTQRPFRLECQGS